jgi:cell division protein FtsL
VSSRPFRRPGRNAPPGDGESPPALSLIRRRSRGLIRRGAGTRLAPLVVLTAICVAALVVAVLLEQVILAQSAFKLARVRREISSAEATNQDLLLRLTRLQSPRRLERYARDRLGMVAPSNRDYIVADVGRRGREVALEPPSRAAGAETALGLGAGQGPP